jgi:hypothetical protein
MRNPIQHQTFIFRVADFEPINPDVVRVFAYALGAKAVETTTSDKLKSNVAQSDFWALAAQKIPTFLELLKQLKKFGFQLTTKGTENDGFIDFINTPFPVTPNPSFGAAFSTAMTLPKVKNYLKSKRDTGEPEYTAQTEAGFYYLKSFDLNLQRRLSWFFKTNDTAWTHFIADRYENDAGQEKIRLLGNQLRAAATTVLPHGQALLTDTSGVCFHNLPSEKSMLTLIVLGGKSVTTQHFEGIILDRVWT